MDYNKEAMEAARRARDGQRAYEEQLDKEARARAKKALAEWFTRVEIHDPPTAPSISDIKRDGKYRTVTFAWSYAGHNYSGSYREYRSPLPSSTVRMVVADTRIPSFLSSPWMRR